MSDDSVRLSQDIQQQLKDLDHQLAILKAQKQALMRETKRLRGQRRCLKKLLPRECVCVCCGTRFIVTGSSRAQTCSMRYRRLAKRHHPDRGGESADFCELNAAYE